MTIVEKLLNKAVEPSAHNGPEMTAEYLEKVKLWVARDANLSDGGRVHNWRNHLGVAKEFWSELSDEARLIVYLLAEAEADRENWD